MLEIGPGPGTNLRCLANNTNINEWVGIESNKFFLEYLDAEKIRRNITFPMSTIWMSGSEMLLPIQDQSFDAVVATHVLCSVDDFSGVLSTIAKALKPNAAYHLMEHVAASEGSVLRTIQLLFEPLFTIVGNGCKFKQTLILLHQSRQPTGLFHNFDFNLTEFDAPVGLPFLKPHIIGTITKPA